VTYLGGIEKGGLARAKANRTKLGRTCMRHPVEARILDQGTKVTEFTGSATCWDSAPAVVQWVFNQNAWEKFVSRAQGWGQSLKAASRCAAVIEKSRSGGHRAARFRNCRHGAGSVAFLGGATALNGCGDPWSRGTPSQRVGADQIRTTAATLELRMRAATKLAR